MTAEHYRKKYQEWLRLKNFTPDTFKTYSGLISVFLFKFVRFNQPKDISRDEIAKYLLTIESPVTRNQTHYTLIAFYREIINQPDKLEGIPVSREPYKLPIVYSVEQVQKLISTIKNIKHRAMVVYQYSCGLRVSEVVNTMLTDIKRDRGIVLIQQAKGRKDRQVPIDLKVLGLLGKDYNEQKLKPKKWLFENENGSQYTKRSVQAVFNGLFEDGAALPLIREDIKIALEAAKQNWSEINPSIMGTLFERGLDPGKRSQLGAHYTDAEKIMMIVRPVIIEPLLREWTEKRAEIESKLEAAKSAKSASTKTKAKNDAEALRIAFIERLKNFRVLDPACGSGNFLYLALKWLKDIEARVNIEAESLGLQRPHLECRRGRRIHGHRRELRHVRHDQHGEQGHGRPDLLLRSE